MVLFICLSYMIDWNRNSMMRQIFYPSWIAYMLCGQQILIIKVRRLYAFRDVLPSVYGAGWICPPIRFKKGLNVVLGKEDGANSIGKSSAMLAIDFVFGGDTYLKSDGVKHIRHHTIFFAFQFCGQKYCFPVLQRMPIMRFFAKKTMIWWVHTGWKMSL